jgi:hypothetical protein
LSGRIRHLSERLGVGGLRRGKGQKGRGSRARVFAKALLNHPLGKVELRKGALNASAHKEFASRLPLPAAISLPRTFQKSLARFGRELFPLPFFVSYAA